jgi:membrane protease YdiL (CAAX protease family)
MNLTSQVVFFSVIGLFLPQAGWRSRRLVMNGALLLPRPQLYVSSMITMGLLLSVTIAVAHANRIRVAFGGMTLRGLAYAAAATVLLVSAALFHARRGNVDAMTMMIVPRTKNERALLAAVALVASVAEELAYRGIAFALLRQWLGVAPAAIAAAILFGLGHLFQGVQAAALTIVFALVAQALVIATGALATAIVVHFLYDVIVAFALGRDAASGAATPS